VPLRCGRRGGGKIRVAALGAGVTYGPRLRWPGSGRSCRVALAGDADLPALSPLGHVDPKPHLRVPTCRRPGVRSRNVPRNASRLPSAPRSGRIRASGRIRCTRMHFFLPEARILPVNDALVTSGHDVPLETARSDHSFTVASMASRRPGWAWAQLARSPLEGPVCRMRGSRARLGVSFAAFAGYVCRFWWLIRASRLFGAGVPLIYRQARIHRGNVPRGVPAAGFWDGCDVRGGGAVTRSPWPRWSAGGQAGPLPSWHAPATRADAPRTSDPASPASASALSPHSPGVSGLRSGSGALPYPGSTVGPGSTAITGQPLRLPWRQQGPVTAVTSTAAAGTLTRSPSPRCSTGRAGPIVAQLTRFPPRDRAVFCRRQPRVPVRHRKPRS
jgi:hypothetical protein